MQRFLGNYQEGAYAIMRVILAFLYWSHGPSWLFGWFTDRPPAALMTRFGAAGVIEIVCGILIALGLLTSWAAFIACGEMAFAYFIAHVPRGSILPIENGGEITVALCFGFLYIATRGGGPFSLDALLFKRRNS